MLRATLCSLPSSPSKPMVKVRGTMPRRLAASAHTSEESIPLDRNMPSGTSLIRRRRSNSIIAASTRSQVCRKPSWLASASGSTSKV